MNNTNLAVVDLANGKDARWLVFTIKGKELVGIDSSCRSFDQIVEKYGPMPAVPLPQDSFEA